ncbi:MAG: dihydrofolate reductase family protein [Boseongicola sp.]
MTEFTLTVAVSVDGYISRTTDEPPQAWASAEEQALFFRDVETADWCIMGRNTHEAADRIDRRRIIFSSKTKGWQRPTQLWLDPADVVPDGLVQQVADVHPLRRGLILGGTRVHDWFLAHGAIDKVHLTIEPITFGAGLRIFSDQSGVGAIEAFTSKGFKVDSDTTLNSEGTRFLELSPL